MGLLDHMVMLVSSLSCVQMFCNPMDCSPSGSSIHGISQARILEWVAIFFSRGSSEPRDWACVSYVLYCWATREAPGSMVVLSLISLESWLFSIVGVLVYIPTNYAQGFPFFPHACWHSLFLVFFDNSHPNIHEVISHSDFDLYFPDDWWCWAPFHVPVGHLYIFLGKISIHILCPLKNWVMFFFFQCWSCMSSLCILHISPLSDMWFAMRKLFSLM